MSIQITVFVMCLFTQFSIFMAEITDQEYDSMPPIFDFDDFEKCLFHNVSNWYCSVTIQLRPENTKNASSTWKIIEEISSQPHSYRHDLLRHGICVHRYNGTAEEKLNHLYGTRYKNLGLMGEVVKLKCETRESVYDPGNADIIVGVVIGIYIFFVLVVTFVLQLVETRSLQKYNELLKTHLGQFFLSFSISENWKLITKSPTDNNRDFIPAMQGIRVVAILCVISIHTGAENMATPVWNPQYVEKFPTKFIGTFHANGGVLVQVYFVLSSWLLVVHMLEKLKKMEKISFGYVVVYIVGRYLRLVPFLAMVVALHSTLLVHVSRGPFWDLVMGEEYRTCRDNWWQNLLFVNNIVPSTGICLIQSWYLSADFQLFVIFTLVLWLIQKKVYLLYYFSGMLNLAHIFAMFEILLSNKWEIAVVPDGKVAYNFGYTSTPQFNSLWISTYSSIPGYALGSIFGYIFWRTKNKKFFTKRYQAILVVLCLFLTLGHVMLYSLYLSSDIYSYRNWFSPVYGSLSKTLFASGIALIFITTSQKIGGVFRKFFEYSFFHIMAQFSFGAYVVHMTIVLIRSGSRMSPPYLSDSFFVEEAVAVVAMSYLLSIVLTLFVQMPFTVLSKKIMPR